MRHGLAAILIEQHSHHRASASGPAKPHASQPREAHPPLLRVARQRARVLRTGRAARGTAAPARDVWGRQQYVTERAPASSPVMYCYAVFIVHAPSANSFDKLEGSTRKSYDLYIFVVLILAILNN
jgi:hypothetical protein